MDLVKDPRAVGSLTRATTTLIRRAMLTGRKRVAAEQPANVKTAVIAKRMKQECVFVFIRVIRGQMALLTMQSA